MWKQIATGVVAASVGAAIFGAVHFMFLAPSYGTGNVMGIPMTVVLPFVLGIAGFAVGEYGHNKEWGRGWLGSIIKYGSAAIIGFGIAEYAGWAVAAVPARARAAAYVPQRAFAPMTAAAPYNAGGGAVKII